MTLLLGLTGCQYGVPPRIPYVHGTAYVAPDGHRERIVDSRTYRRMLGITGIAPYRGGHLVADGRAFEGTVGLFGSVGGKRTALGPCATAPTPVSPDGRWVAWLTMGCPESNQTGTTVVHVAATAGQGGWSRDLGHQYLYFASGFLGDAVVIGSWTGPVLVVPERGPVTELPHLRYAVDIDRGLVAGRHGVVDATTGRQLWYDPSAELVSFSPDGSRLLGYSHRDLVLLDTRTGEPVAELPERLFSPTWEDDRHLLAVSYRRGISALVRVGLDGRAELVTVPGRSGPQTWVFETQPQ